VVAPDEASADDAAAALGAACATVSAFKAPSGAAWQVQGFAAEKPQAALIEAMLALAWRGRDTAPPDIAIERVAERDWLAENQASFPPLAAGRYFIHGSHHQGGLPAGRVALMIDAATAFGTGEHASTRGCLLALDRLARRRPRRRVLDMGTGTGILAIAAAKTWRRTVAARDIDAEAVRVTARNAAANGVAALVDVRRSDGYRERTLRRVAPFDLVFANILARPLMLMAKDLAGALQPGGIAVLAGLLARQENAVLAAHRAQGLRLRHRIARDGWHTLVLERRATSSR
jgi:ribosomal protein L11 methyltransferase